ncbi:hypothetical protein V6N11_034328 [Hibiscus sabdariffa]|uniref:Uncharacterized protein n=1 Tax=Hibiscus sabdariffa TaxID=183260 RepID=A0ABR1ZDX8_9ROSI
MALAFLLLGLTVLSFGDSLLPLVSIFTSVICPAWVEDEAKRAREETKGLEKAREHWERHGNDDREEKKLASEAGAKAEELKGGAL